MTALDLPALMRDDIVAHAREEAPRECCGIISGKGGVASELIRMTNLDEGNEFYIMDDEELYRVVRSIEEADEEVMVIYHSHPVSEPYPSKTDVELAFWEESTYLICSLEQPDDPKLRAFQIVQGVITEAEIRIVS